MNNAYNTIRLVIIARELIMLRIIRRFNPNRQILTNQLCTLILNSLHLLLCWLPLQVNVVHTLFSAHTPSESLEIVAVLHNGGEEMLAGMLLHVIPSSLPVDFLTDSVTWG